MDDDQQHTPGFADLGLEPGLVGTLAQLGYEEPTPIQREAIPPVIEGRDLLGQAATGTGKTAAFALPLVQRLPPERSGNPSALVLVPTRELAIQVSEAVRRYGRHKDVQVLPIYGGQPIHHQLRALQRGVDVVVATPGRALDHIRRNTLRLAEIELVVLDEADEMLDMGFAEDLEAILAETPPERQTLLFSATLPGRILGIADRHLRDPLRIEIARDKPEPGEAPKVRQVAYVVPRPHKLNALGRVLDIEAPGAALVFCRTRNEVDDLTEALNARGYRAEALHGGMSQERRDRVMRKLRGQTAELMIATDVAARGLDLEQLTHVINFDVPSSPETYVHRIGRVGRAGREGTAITLAEPREHRLMKNIERLIRQRIPVEKIPTIADLRARRLELLRASLREVLVAGDFEHYRVVVEGLAGEFDVMDVALAAVKLLDGHGGESEPEIPDQKERRDRPERPRPDRKERQRDERGSPDMVRLYVGLGRQAGVRPGDLFGAIANEAGIAGREIGAIDIGDKFSIVEVAESRAKEVIESLRHTTIQGQRVVIRRDRVKPHRASGRKPGSGE